ncbi:hypothetical protein A3Q56_00252 [Intoshia linei]|uniref:Uncharacterized protein n=1 Tax=Intoshia linei TaxID=1819745 RepID=A0A177BEF7_9BILA|nr:hypothetical protein A3Q56_00252 [Intoshia linei]
MKNILFIYVSAVCLIKSNIVGGNFNSRGLDELYIDNQMENNDIQNFHTHVKLNLDTRKNIKIIDKWNKKIKNNSDNGKNAYHDNKKNDNNWKTKLNKKKKPENYKHIPLARKSEGSKLFSMLTFLTNNYENGTIKLDYADTTICKKNRNHQNKILKDIEEYFEKISDKVENIMNQDIRSFKQFMEVYLQYFIFTIKRCDPIRAYQIENNGCTSAAALEFIDFIENHDESIHTNKTPSLERCDPTFFHELIEQGVEETIHIYSTCFKELYIKMNESMKELSDIYNQSKENENTQMMIEYTNELIKQKVSSNNDMLRFIKNLSESSQKIIENISYQQDENIQKNHKQLVE